MQTDFKLYKVDMKYIRNLHNMIKCFLFRHRVHIISANPDFSSSKN